MNGKANMVQWIIGIFLGIITTMGGTIFKLQNDKVKVIDKKVDKEVKDREKQDDKHDEEISTMQETITNTANDVKWICKSMGKKD